MAPIPNQLLKTLLQGLRAARRHLLFTRLEDSSSGLGFGIFYNQDIGNAVFDMARNIAGRVTLNSNTTGTPNLFYSNAVPGGSGAVAQIPPPYAYVDAYCAPHVVHDAIPVQYPAPVRQRLVA